MQYKTFVISVNGDTEGESQLNKFLRSCRPIQVEHHLSGDKWLFLVEYQNEVISEESAPVKRHKNVTEGQPQDVVDRFSRYRKLRKDIADRRGVPPYIIFTDKELIEISKLKELNWENIKEIKTIPKKRLEENIEHFISSHYEETDETSGSFDGEDLPL